MAMQSVQSVKIVIMGDAEVGKTSIINQFFDKSFSSEYKSSFGVLSNEKQLEIDGKNVNLNFLDLPGQEKFRSLWSLESRDADYYVLVYDVTNSKSFLDMEKMYDELLSQLKISKPNQLPIIILGNKIDLPERSVEERTARAYVEFKGNIPYYEVSSKTGQNITSTIEFLVRKALENKRQKDDTKSTSTSTNKKILHDDKMYLKIKFFGDSRVGTTSFINQLVYNEISPKTHEQNLGHLYVKEFDVDGKKVLMDIYDDNFQISSNVMARQNDCFVFVYDVTKYDTFTSIKKLIDELKDNLFLVDPNNLPFIILGNKADLPNRAVNEEEVREFAKNNGNIIFYEVSSKTGKNTSEPFADFVRKKKYYVMYQRKTSYFLNEWSFKMFFLGDSNVGKTCLINRFINKKYMPMSNATLGINMDSKLISINGKEVNCEIYDSSGQELFRSEIRKSFHGVECCVLVYDVLNHESFEHIKKLREEFINELDLSNPNDFPFLLLGNKSDHSERSVKEEEAREYAQQNNMLFYEVSSKTGKNVRNSFESIAKRVLEKIPKFKRETFSIKKEIKDVEFRLNPGCVKLLPFDQYEKDFTFIVNGKTYQTSRVIADLLSPRICNMHYTDPSCKEFVINIKNITEGENDYFEDFLSLCTFENSVVDSTRFPFFLQYFFELRNVEGCLTLDPDYFESPTEEILYDRLQIFSEPLNGSSDQIIKLYKDYIDYFSENFEVIDKDKIASFPKRFIADIIKNKNLRIKSEDSLLEFALDLYKKDNSYWILFESVLFSQVSEDLLAELINEIKVKNMNDKIFQSICMRFFNKQEEVNPERYICESKVFSPKDDDEKFDGILRYLTKKAEGNIHLKKFVEIYSNSINGDHHPFNAVDFDKDNFYLSNDQNNSFVLFDFNDMSVQISSYSIQSCKGNKGHMKNWSIEASNDGNNWIEIDKQTDNSKLNGDNYKSRFDIQKRNRNLYRYLRIKETGDEWNNHYIGFSFIEFYGKVEEPKE